ncbi:hypothetical protein [Streptomyces sp. HGB0020]|uniref:hypothetical protein n=1 Tax=Streptomyces sp. HGB0020 TaxID=1078086 RepID=UPI00034E0435|nr:hypothetical protein [Streptomyces sp. HGB0020]EPD67241.1 hypothetical protein HMPREF1211_01499 [Streptomyces sp. HGB0020]
MRQANPGNGSHRKRGFQLKANRTAWIAGAALTCTLAGFATVGISAASTPSAAPSATPTALPTDGGRRADPSDGGATGIVQSTSSSGFTLKTATGVTVTVSDNASTTFLKNNHHTSAKAVKKGTSVLVLGLVDSADITAAKVVVQPHGDGGAAAAEAAGVIPFQQGTPSPDKSVGTIPDYTEGEGTIQTGAVAYKATTAAQAVVPGGIVDRVVRLADGEYEVHNISINWPHHLFVNKDFKVVGYE